MRRWIKRIGQGLKGLALMGVLLVLAWLASNGRWADARPQPVPVELALRPVTVPPERNAFFDMQGIAAAEGADINAAGRAVLLDGKAGPAPAFSWPKGELWQCRASERDCVRHERLSKPALRAIARRIRNSAPSVTIGCLGAQAADSRDR